MDVQLAVLAALPRLWSAAPPPPKDMAGAITNVFQQLLLTGTDVGLAVCTVFVALAGFQYMSAGGNVRALEGAKQSLFSALIGLAIVLGAHVTAAVVGDALKGIPQQ